VVAQHLVQAGLEFQFSEVIGFLDLVKNRTLTKFAGSFGILADR
jgi:hypothetical protein